MPETPARTREVGPAVTLVTAAVSIGVPVLIVLFYFEGLIVGKLLQPPIVFVGYVTIVDPAAGTAAAIAIGCGVGATIGQWTLYRGFNDDAPEYLGLRRHVPYLDALPTIVTNRVSERRRAFVDRQFEAHGGVALCLTNAVPGIRGLMTIAAGISGYPVRRFVLASGIGNGLYFVLLLAAAWGVSGAARLVGA